MYRSKKDNKGKIKFDFCFINNSNLIKDEIEL